MNNVLTILRREFQAYFLSPIAYFVYFVLFAYTGWTWYHQAVQFSEMCSYVVQQSQMMQQPPPNLNVTFGVVGPTLFNILFVFIFLVPLVTMRQYAEEQKSGTMELLLTAPLTNGQIIVGKFLASFLFLATAIALTFPYVALVGVFGAPHWPSVGAAYLGIFLCTGSFVAWGLFFSSVTENQIIAAAGAYVANLFFFVIYWAVGRTEGVVETFFENLSVITHVSDFMQGIVDVKDLVYYATTILFALYLTSRQVESRRWRL